MTKTINITDLQLDQKIKSEPFSLKQFEKKISKNGKFYYNLLIGDKTGEMRGKLWSEASVNSDLDLKTGDIVAITGYVQEYA